MNEDDIDTLVTKLSMTRNMLRHFSQYSDEPKLEKCFKNLSTCLDLIQSVNFRFVNRVKITYRVNGKTHNGYCSDPEEVNIGDYYTTETKTLDVPILESKFKKGFLRKSKFDLSFFNYKEIGCGTGGSGYCNDSDSGRVENREKYKRVYTAVKVEKLE